MNFKLSSLGIALVAGLALAVTGVLPSPAFANQTIQAKALTEHECNSSEWHFVITQLNDSANAPASIQVTWANGQSATVPLDPPVTGGTAHYRTTANLDSQVTSATASIYDGWSGQFNLSHGPCGTAPGEPNLAIDKSGPTSLTEGTAGSYSIVVSNTGNGPTEGLVTLTDALPNGLTGVSVSGSGWTCDTSGVGNPTANDSFTCTRSNALAAGASYPAVTVNFTAPNDVCGEITNVASVSGGGDDGANPDAQDSVVTQITGCTQPQTGSITIIKNVLGGTDPENFCFESDLGEFCLDDDGNNNNALSDRITFSGLSAGEYDFTELEPEDWDLESITCSAAPGAADVDISLGAETVSVDLSAGQSVTCRFNNREQQSEGVTRPEPPSEPEVEREEPPVVVAPAVPPVVVQAPAPVVQVAPATPPLVAEVAGVSAQLPTQLPRTGSGGYLDESAGGSTPLLPLLLAVAGIAFSGFWLLARRQR